MICSQARNNDDDDGGDDDGGDDDGGDDDDDDDDDDDGDDDDGDICHCVSLSHTMPLSTSMRTAIADFTSSPASTHPPAFCGLRALADRTD